MVGQNVNANNTSFSMYPLVDRVKGGVAVDVKTLLNEAVEWLVVIVCLICVCVMAGLLLFSLGVRKLCGLDKSKP